MKNGCLTKTQFSYTWVKRWIKPATLMVLVTLVFFAYGVGVGHYQWPPFWQIEEVKNTLTQLLPERAVEYRGEAELLVYAFTDPVEETDLYYPPITDLEGIRRANDRIFMLRQGFETAYEDLQVLAAEQLNQPQGVVPVVRVRFEYQDREHEAFAYGRLPPVCEGNNSASLIIPGSGLNQSLGIATGDKANYHHGILDALNAGGGEIFTLIKPNEDFLAWHDGNGKKLSGDFIWNWHLNREGSYSVSYLVQSLAFMKWMQDCFDRAMVAGLSQGGAAAMLNALESRPDLAIVSSGHSIVNNLAEWSGPGQLIGVPGLGALSTPHHLADRLAHTQTQWFFSWGTKERGTYKIEANEERTATVISHLPNVRTVIHDDGHIFPVEAIQIFLANHSLRNSNRENSQ